VSNDGMINELERIWKEAVMPKFKVLFWLLPEGTEENHLAVMFVLQCLSVTLIVVKHYAWLIIFLLLHIIIVAVVTVVDWERSVSKVTC
jgi:hypothetical protein